MTFAQKYELLSGEDKEEIFLGAPQAKHMGTNVSWSMRCKALCLALLMLVSVVSKLKFLFSDVSPVIFTF
jgi:type II secretory pathway component PulL